MLGVLSSCTEWAKQCRTSWTGGLVVPNTRQKVEGERELDAADHTSVQRKPENTLTYPRPGKKGKMREKTEDPV